jgi:tRNA(Ile)-lysidine synthase
MQQILQTVLLARDDKLPCVDYGDVEVRRYRDDLYVMQRLLSPPDQQAWDFSVALSLNGIGVLQAQQVQGQGLRADIKNVTVKFRQGGEVMQLPGRTCHHELKKLLQSWGVPPWMRDRVPLLFVGDELAAVVGYAVAASYAAKVNEPGWLITLS